MLRTLSATGILMLAMFSTYAQGLQDTVVQLKAVEITTERLFEKQEAGMRTMQVDSAVITEKANLSLSQVLSENTSVFIKDYGRGALATASFRGTAPSHTTVNWNGITISSPMTGMVDFSLIPVNIIDGLELRHGSAAIADHGGGIGGSISINNNPGWDNDIDIRYIQGIGSYRTFNEFLQFGFGNRKVRSETRLYHNYSANDFTFINRGVGEPDPETGKIVHPTDINRNAAYRNYGILQELYLKPTGKDIVSIKWWLQESRRAIPRATSYEGPDNSNLNSQENTDNRLVAGWDHYEKRSHLSVRAGYAGKDLLYRLDNTVPGLGEVPAVYSESKQHSSLNKISYSYNLQESFNVEASIDANWHGVESNDTVSKTGYTSERSELSLFLALSKSFFGRLNVNLMLRQDWADFRVLPFVPYLGFDLRIIKNSDFFLKGNIARNYRLPSLNDLYWQPGGNPGLRPEDGFSFELGSEYSVAFSDQDLVAELTFYKSDISNWIIWIPGYKGYWEPKNISRVISSGIEFTLHFDGKLGGFGYRLLGNYAFTSSVNYGERLTWGDESYGSQLPYIPLHSGNVMVNLSWKGFFVSYQHNSYSERYTTSSNDLSSRNRLYPYFMNDLAFGKELRFKRVILSAEFKIFNLFDETYHTVLYRPMPGRNYLLTLMVNYRK